MNNSIIIVTVESTMASLHLWLRPVQEWHWIEDEMVIAIYYLFYLKVKNKSKFIA